MAGREQPTGRIAGIGASGAVHGPTTPRWSAERRGPGFARDAPRLASVASRPTSATTGSTPPGAPPAPSFRGRVTKRPQRGCKRKARTRPQDCGAGTKKRTLFDIVNGNDASGPLGSGARRAITSAATRSGHGRGRAFLRHQGKSTGAHAQAPGHGGHDGSPPASASRLVSSFVWSAHRSPRAVRVATGVAARDLRLAVAIDRVGVLPALLSVGLVGGAGNHRSIPARVRVLPGDRRARFSAFERLHLCRIGALLVVIVHGGADAIAEQAADRRTGKAGGNTFAGPTAELRADQPPGYHADERARILPRSGSSLGIAAARGRRHRDERGGTQAHKRHL